MTWQDDRIAAQKVWEELRRYVKPADHTRAAFVVFGAYYSVVHVTAQEYELLKKLKHCKEDAIYVIQEDFAKASEGVNDGLGVW